MPVKVSPIDEPQQSALTALGGRIRARRKALHVSATAAAEAAGVSRVTLHRIERGEPSVAMGLYLSAVTSLGLALELSDPGAGTRAPGEAAPLPDRVRLDELPQLQRLAWQLNRAAELTPKEALDLYERNWRHVDTAAMTPHERAALGNLVRTVGGGGCLFEREHHRRIARLLQALDGHALATQGCLFGGGTAIALRYGEYRESVDVDFLVSHLPGYRALRQMLTGPDGLRAITRPGHELALAREVRADQYGLRTLVRVDDTAIKLEIVHEARMSLDAPAATDAVCGVPTLTPLDLAASKLLANSDRWADGAVHSRDLIDLAMMQPDRPLLRRALAKAAAAYGDSIQADLTKAIAALRGRPQRLAQCMLSLGMNTVPRALLWSRIRRLRFAPLHADGLVPALGKIVR